MGRPRQHDLDTLRDHARELWVTHGAGGVTIRALSAVSGVSNGAIYNAFGSRDGLLASVWTREADLFLAYQRDRVDRAITSGAGPVDAAVEAALAPAAYATQDDHGARLLLAVTLDDLLTPDLDETNRQQLTRLRSDLAALIERLSGELWGRTDRAAIATVTYCVVNLPGALLLKPAKVTDPLARHVLEHAVRGVLATPPPAPATRNNTAARAPH